MRFFGNKNLIYLFLVATLVLVFALAPMENMLGMTANAEVPPKPDTSGDSGKIDNPLGENKTLSQFFSSILLVARNIGFLVAVFFIVYSGFLFVTAKGNEEQITKARDAFLWAVVGAAVILGAQVFANSINETVRDLGSVLLYYIA